MRYFIVANSFAAPFVSDRSEVFQMGETPEKALEKFIAAYKHPAGLYAAVVYSDANAYHEDEEPLLTWLCNREQTIRRVTKRLSGYSMCSLSPNEIEINGKVHHVDDPRGGSIVR